MRKITALIAQKRNRNRVNVFLDGRFGFGLAAIEAALLRVGQTLSDEEIDHLRERDAFEKARERALHFLSYRPRSQNEIRQHLQESKVAPEHIDEIITRLAGVGLVDDATFARFWVENRDQFRPRGTRALRYELRHKGLPPEVIEAALAGRDDEAAAQEAARAQARRLRHLPRPDFQRRLAAFLARRGFDYDIITEVVERIWQEAAADLSEEHEG